MKQQILVMIIFLFVLTSSHISAQAPESPEGRVRNFYQWVGGNENKGVESRKQKKVIFSFFSGRHYRWFYKLGVGDQNTYLISGNDWLETFANKINVGKSLVKANRAAVTVDLGDSSDDFVNHIRVNLLREEGVWKIDCLENTDLGLTFDPRRDPPGCRPV